MPREPQPSDRSDHPEADYGCVRKRRHHLRVRRSGPPEGPAHHAAFSPRSDTRLRPRWPKPVSRAPRGEVDGAAAIESPRREKRARDVPAAGRVVRHRHRAQPALPVGREPAEHGSPDRRVRDLQPGLGLVIITGGIDLSVGSAFALLGVLLSIMLTEWHVAWPAAVVIMLALGALLGGINGMADHAPGTAAIHRHVVRLAPVSRSGAVHRRRRDERVW